MGSESLQQHRDCNPAREFYRCVPSGLREQAEYEAGVGHWRFSWLVHVHDAKLNTDTYSGCLGWAMSIAIQIASIMVSLSSLGPTAMRYD